MRFLETIIALALAICIVGWMFETDFLLLDILLSLGIIAIQIAIAFILLIIVIWIIKELFN
jgi:hypothetical protein